MTTEKNCLLIIIDFLLNMFHLENCEGILVKQKILYMLAMEWGSTYQKSRHSHQLCVQVNNSREHSHNLGIVI